MTSHSFLYVGFGNDQRLSRQGAANGDEVDEIGPLDIGTIAQAGERCVEKVQNNHYYFICQISLINNVYVLLFGLNRKMYY